jgi:hypothetical protein
MNWRHISSNLAPGAVVGAERPWHAKAARTYYEDRCGPPLGGRLEA